MRRACLVLGLLLPVLNSWAQVSSTNGGSRALASIELRDQFDRLQCLEFPTTNVVVLTIADRKGASQVDDWISVLKRGFAGRVEFRGMAHVAEVPSFLRGRVRRSFQATRQHPVMMDWSGKYCDRLGFVPNEANVLIVSKSGEILGRFHGTADAIQVEAAAGLIKSSLRK